MLYQSESESDSLAFVHLVGLVLLFIGQLILEPESESTDESDLPLCLNFVRLLSRLRKSRNPITGEELLDEESESSQRLFATSSRRRICIKLLGTKPVSDEEVDENDVLLRYFSPTVDVIFFDLKTESESSEKSSNVLLSQRSGNGRVSVQGCFTPEGFFISFIRLVETESECLDSPAKLYFCFVLFS